MIRRALTADIAAIVRLWEDLQAANAGYDKRLTALPKAGEWYAAFIREQLNNASAAVYVAEEDDKVVGYAFGQVMQRPTLAEGDCGYVVDVSVTQAYRGRGLGRDLYQALREWFVRAGIRHIEVQVVRGNPASQAFWRKMGFGELLRTLRYDA